MRPEGRPDPFAAGREETRRWTETLAALREEVAALVEREVRQRETPPERLEELVRAAVRSEVERRSPGRTALPPWSWLAAAGAVGAVLGLVLAFGFYALRGGGEGAPAEADRAAAAAGVAGPSAAAGGAAPQPGAGVAEAPASPEARAARFDSLFGARSPLLDPLLGRLADARPAASVGAALAAFREGRELDGAAAERLRSALLQQALNEIEGAGLVLDGAVQRQPCGGRSCGALLDLWRSRGEAVGLPPWSEAAAADPARLSLAERLVVLHRVESP